MINKAKRVQIQILRRIFRAFKISLVEVMEFKAAIPPVEVRLNYIYKMYVLRVFRQEADYSIRDRIPNFFLFINNNILSLPVDFRKFLNWNKIN